MENKEFLNDLSNDMQSFKIALLANMKKELKDFVQIQRNLKNLVN